jgi:hypothetical protein
MKKIFLPLLLSLTIFFSGCSKGHSDDDVQYGTSMNTWTFTEGSTVYKGDLAWDPILNTLLQGNNSYTFAMIGPDNESGNTFNVVLSLLDLNFTAKTYQSGIDGNDYLNAFYYFANVGDNIYKSSNLDPGNTMTYTITSYNASTDNATMTFSGQVVKTNGTVATISNGKVTFHVDRM